LRSRLGYASVSLGFAAVIAVTSLFFVLVDRGFYAWMPDGEIVVLALGFLILSRFFTQRTRYQREFGERAYSSAFVRFVIPGLGIVAASIAHLAYMAGPEIPELWWTPILRGVGWVLVVMGFALWLRAIFSLGLDILVLLYVYVPAEGRLASSSIYAVIRHPIYAAALNIGTGLACIHANWYALLVVPVLALFFFGWVRLVEEPELLARLPGYLEYRKRVPAFFPWPRDLLNFFRFLVVGR
jgi:protein-S-isoprenylcysteine O-methyltransferase Ste14